MSISRAHSWRNRKAQTQPTVRLFTLLAGLFLLAVSSTPFFQFPVLGFALLPLGLIYLAVLFVLPRAWLVILPLATVTVDLSSYTGRFHYNEFDYLVLLTISAGLLFDRYRLQVYEPRRRMIPVALFYVLLLLNTQGWLAFVLPPGLVTENPYYVDAYSYKVVKGFLWGALLVPMWGYHLAQDKNASVRVLVAGCATAACALGLVVLWERHTLGLLLQWSPWWHIAQSLFDLASPYRITGLFADMHTGGEVIDGTILLLLPVCVYGFFSYQHPAFRALCALACAALAYATMVGFTRTTYVAVAFSVASWSALVLFNRARAGMPPPFPLRWGLLFLAVALLSALVVFRLAGSYGMLSMALLIGLSALAPLRWRGQSLLPGVAIAALLVLVAGVRAHLGSRWADPGMLSTIAVTLGLLLPAGAGYLYFRHCVGLGALHRVTSVAVVVACSSVVGIALGGYQIGERTSRVSEDLGTRAQHWADVIASSEGGFGSALAGNGVGTFPASYIGRHPDKVSEVGRFSIVPEGRDRLLRLEGGSDLTLGQRVTIDPWMDYTVDLRLRAMQNTSLVLALCERNLIYASGFSPDCVSRKLDVPHADGGYQQLAIEFNAETVGEGGPLMRWPTVLELRFRKPGTVEVDTLRLTSEGFNRLQNSRFGDGLDHWFFYNDFAHLPWHVKNLFLQVWFELGWLGLLVFFILLATLLFRACQPRSADSLMPVYASAVLGVCLFGLFGSPLDSARVSWLFSFMLLAGLASLRSRGRRSRWKKESAMPQA